MKRHPAAKEFEFSKITSFIYIGTNQCCTMHFDRTLLEKGVKADISLDDKKIDQSFGVRYFLWIPTKNHFPPRMEQLKLGVMAIDFLVENKIKTYVHCQNGHGRAPTLVAAYLISKGYSVEKAINFIKKRRPSIHLEKVQIKALIKFQRMLF